MNQEPEKTVKIPWQTTTSGHEGEMPPEVRAHLNMPVPEETETRVLPNPEVCRGVQVGLAAGLLKVT